MKILIHMGDSYPNEGPNAKRMRTFYDQFKQSGHEVKVLAPCSDENESNPDTVYCRTIPLKKKTSLNRLLNQVFFGISSLLTSFHVGKVDVVITTAPPALISPFGWMIAKIKRAKLVYDVRDIWPDVALEMGSFTEKSMYCRVFTFVRNFMLRHSDMVTTVSPGKVEKLKLYQPSANIYFVTNGIDETFLTNEEDQSVIREYDLDHGYNVVYIGNLGWAQGLRQLLFVAERAQSLKMPVRFKLFGSGVDEKNLKEYALRHGLHNVTFPGRLPNRQMYTILKNADLSFVSLLNENMKDSVPTKMFEALSVGCPVLLAAVGDAADILNESRLGIAVKPNDNEGLWKAFEKMYYTMPEILKNKEHAMKLMVAKYSRQKAAEKMEQLISGL